MTINQTSKPKVKIVKKKVDDTQQVIDFLKDAVQKDFGIEAIMQMNDDGKKRAKMAFSYGWKALDEISGINGVPRGRVIEIYGPESSGKTTLALHMAAECQKVKGVVAFLDAEHAIDIDYAQKLGVNIDAWLLNQPDYGEQVFQIMNKMVAKKTEQEGKNAALKDVPLLLIVDSVAALTPEAEIKGVLDDNSKGAGLGEHARMMSQCLRVLTSVCGKSNATIVFINQTRMKIGVKFGSPETTTGGNALKFYASVRIRICRTGSEKQGETIIGNLTKVKIVKNKLAPPFKECEGLIVFGEGFNKEWDLWRVVQDKQLAPFVKKPWRQFTELGEDSKKFCGYNGFKNMYKEDPGPIDKILENC